MSWVLEQPGAGSRTLRGKDPERWSQCPEPPSDTSDPAAHPAQTPQREEDVRFSFSEAPSIWGWMALRPVQGAAGGAYVALRPWQQAGRE